MHRVRPWLQPLAPGESEKVMKDEQRTGEPRRERLRVDSIDGICVLGRRPMATDLRRFVAQADSALESRQPLGCR